MSAQCPSCGAAASYGREISHYPGCLAAIPGYWMNETSGVLRPAVENYLHGKPMTAEQIAAMRAYLRQWINAPGFLGPEIDALRRAVDRLTDRPSIDLWINAAVDAGADPL